MKLKNSLYIMFFGLIGQILWGMEKPNSCVTTIDIVTNILPDVVRPKKIDFVRDNIIVALGKHSFCVFDMQKNEVIVKKDDKEKKQTFYDFAVDKNKQKIALCGSDFLTVYCVSNGQQQWYRNIRCYSSVSLAFNPQDSSRVLEYNGKTNIVTFHSMFYKSRSMQLPGRINLIGNNLFAHHPTETEIIFNLNEFGYKYWDYMGVTGVFGYSLGECLNACDDVMDICYSVDGTDIAITVSDRWDTTIVFPKTKKIFKVGGLYVAMIFHPNKKIVFLLDRDNNIKCWDFFKEKCVCNIQFSGEQDISSRGVFSKRLTISDNGKKLFVALKNKCTMISVPFVVLYDSDVQKKLVQNYFVIKNFEHNGVRLIKDIVSVITKKLAKLYRHDWLA